MKYLINALVLLVLLVASADSAQPPPNWPYIDLTPQSGAPTLANGRCWTTSAGLFCRVNGATVGPYSTGTGTAANPTATVGPSATNGVATTYMRSDGAPALANTAVTPGSYTYMSGTVDAQGRLTSAGNGSAPAAAANPTGTAGPTAVNGSASTYMRSDGAPAVQKASSSQFGIVEVDNQTILSAAGVISTAAPSRTATTPTVATTDMGGTIWATGTITIPAITTGLFDAKQTLLLVNVTGSTETVTSSPTVNAGGGCIQAGGIPAGYAWQIQSNNTTLDCQQIVSSVAISQLAGLGTGVATAAAANLSAAGGLSTTVASGTSALGTSAISSATCATAVTTSATNTATTDVIWWGFNGDPTAVTGYVPLVAGMLTIVAYPSANNVNFKVCNLSSGSITPGAITLNWRVIR